MTSNLREATKNDIEQITNIYNDAILSKISTADTSAVSMEQKLEDFLRQDKKRYPVWVNEYCGKVIAYIVLRPFHRRIGYDKTCEICIYIDKNFQGQKLGKKFLSEAINKTKELGFENLLAFIFKDNEVCIRLFKKFGFKEWGHLPKIAHVKQTEKDLVILGLKNE